MIYIVNTEILLKVALNTITHTLLTVNNKAEGQVFFPLFISI
jgi:hypothetical protein